MSESFPAIWSAVAASFAAFSSLILLRIQRNDSLESDRPELVLTGWSRESSGQGDGLHEVIRFTTIKNIGRGSALHIYLRLVDIELPAPTALMATGRHSILAVDEEHLIDGRISLWWKNTPKGGNGPRYIPLTILIYCWDNRGRRHETKYTMRASEDERVASTDVIAPGLMLISRTATARSVRILKIRRRLNRIYGIGRFFRSTD